MPNKFFKRVLHFGKNRCIIKAKRKILISKMEIRNAKSSFLGQDGLRGLSNAAKHAAGGFSNMIDAIFSIF